MTLACGTCAWGASKLIRYSLGKIKPIILVPVVIGGKKIIKPIVKQCRKLSKFLKCKPCIPRAGSILYEIVPPGARRRGRHAQPGHNNGHVKYWTVTQAPAPNCGCFWAGPVTLENMQIPPVGRPGGPRMGGLEAGAGDDDVLSRRN